MVLSQFSLLLALLVVAANLLTVALVAGKVARHKLWARRWAAALQPIAMPVAAFAAASATAASLTLSEHYGLPPCRLCWYQRYAMYPLAAALAVASIGRFRRLRLPLALIAAAGLAVSAYHVALERIPALDTGSCDLDNPCSIIWFARFGFVTIPYGAGSVFLLVLALLSYARPSRAPQASDPAEGLGDSDGRASGDLRGAGPAVTER